LKSQHQSEFLHYGVGLRPVIATFSFLTKNELIFFHRGANSALKMATFLGKALAYQLSETYKNRIPLLQRWSSCDCSLPDDSFAITATEHLGQSYQRFFETLATREQNRRALPIQDIEINPLMDVLDEPQTVKDANSLKIALKSRLETVAIRLHQPGEWIALWPHNNINIDALLMELDRLQSNSKEDRRIIYLLYRSQVWPFDLMAGREVRPDVVIQQEALHEHKGSKIPWRCFKANRFGKCCEC
jgi:hypothetical protein